MSWTENKWLKPAWIGGGNDFVTKYQDKFAKIGEKFAPKIVHKSSDSEWGNVIYLVRTERIAKGGEIDYEEAMTLANHHYEKLGVNTRVVPFDEDISKFDAKLIQKNESFIVMGVDKEDVVEGLREVNADEAYIGRVEKNPDFGTEDNPEMGNTEGTQSGIAIAEMAIILFLNKKDWDQWLKGVSYEEFAAFLMVHASIHNTGFKHGKAKKASGSSLYGFEADGKSVRKAFENGNLTKFSDLFFIDRSEIIDKKTNKPKERLSNYEQGTLDANSRSRLALKRFKFGEGKARASIDTITGESIVKK
ncbi:MAG: hypothetical protein ACKVTZ_10135 [Bacteroidia bacterium]